MMEEVEFIVPEVSPEHRYMFKKRCLTIFLHDYAQPPAPKMPFLFHFMTIEGRPPNPVPIQLYNNYTLEGLRRMSVLELGRILKSAIGILDEHIEKIENNNE